MNKNWLKRLLLIFSALALVMALLPATAFAQEGEGGEEATTEEVAGEETGEEEAASEEAAESHEEEGGLLTPLGINGGLMIAQVVNFLLLAGVMGAFIWKPAVNMLDSRSAKIQKGIEDAAAAAKARQNAEAEAEKILTEARAERQKMLNEARETAEDVRKQMEAEAEADAKEIREAAQAEADAQRNAQLADVREDVVKIATAVAGRVLGEELDEDKQRDLVSNFLSNVPEGAKSMSGTVTVVSAMPLTDDERSRVESEISADGYEYEVNPDILGGLIVRGSDRRVDGSVRGSLDDLSGRLG